MKKFSYKEMIDIGFIQSSDNDYIFLSLGCELEYNTKSGSVYAINDGFGEPEFLCITFDLTVLSDLRLQYDGFEL